MKLFKGLLTLIGAIVVFGLAFAFVKFDLGTRIGQVAKLDSQALPEYMKMFDVVLETGDPAKGMIRRAKMNIPEGMTKEEAIANAIELMDEVAEEYGLAVVDNKIMNRKPHIQIRAYCSKTIGEKFVAYSPYFIGFMPCRIGIVEDPKTGDVYVYTMSLELMINGGHTLPKEMLQLANEVRSGMYAMLKAAEEGD
ncbi:DUF302 domain-containing protein [Sulfurovum sp. ST-21]|uniref:DUF302 domain-containing protein n=1 Tax=Sulfurovum indicum TaxID=2779528 RepID=A0A7M1S7Y6_9BACT|nr:DUF302 domain-containing protein [Sulfurovum indicum]QOR62829.1 DUF302 domain-containing protein [Sulfurovum indicum]